MKTIAGSPTWFLTDRQRHESYEGPQCLVRELPLVGHMHLLDALPNSLVPHAHQGIYEIHYVIQGSLSFWVGEQTYSVRPGMAFLTCPDEVHGAVDELLSPAEWNWVHIRFPQGRPLPGLSLANTERIESVLKSAKRRLFSCSSDVKNCFDRLLNEHRKRPPMASVAARATFQELLVSMVRKLTVSNQSSSQSAPSPTMQAVLGWIDEHLVDSFSVDELANAVGLSPSSLRLHFHTELGCSPNDYTMRRRIDIAKQMLSNPRLSVTQIAFQLGFNSSAYFTAVFKRLTGENPTEYRRHTAQIVGKAKASA